MWHTMLSLPRGGAEVGGAAAGSAFNCGPDGQQPQQLEKEFNPIAQNTLAGSWFLCAEMLLYLSIHFTLRGHILSSP
jgi:hypothetical protein